MGWHDCSLINLMTFFLFPTPATASRLISAMDFNVNPCHDFFNYACANWNKEHIIPDDRTSISTFEVMADKVQVQLRSEFTASVYPSLIFSYWCSDWSWMFLSVSVSRTIAIYRLVYKTLHQTGLLEEADTNTTIDAMKKAKLMFSSCMNISEIEQIGHAPLVDIMARYGHWPVASSSPSVAKADKWREGTNMTVEELIATIHRDLNVSAKMYKINRKKHDQQEHDQKPFGELQKRMNWRRSNG